MLGSTEFRMVRRSNAKVSVVSRDQTRRRLLLRTLFLGVIVLLAALALRPAYAADCNPAHANLDPKAVERFKAIHSAALKADHDAQYELARLYRDGSGVKPDLVRAYAWLNVAARGHREASAERDHVGRCLGPAEQIKAELLSLELLSGATSH